MVVVPQVRSVGVVRTGLVRTGGPAGTGGVLRAVNESTSETKLLGYLANPRKRFLTPFFLFSTGNLRLISCNAGEGDLAQNLANKLGVTVEAATTGVNVPMNFTGAPGDFRGHDFRGHHTDFC